MNDSRPPRYAEAMLRHFLSPPDAEVVAGDLCEEFQRRAGPRWIVSAWYLGQVVRIGWRYRSATHLGGGGIRSDVKVGMRQLIRQPGFTVITTLALALGVGINAVITQLAGAVFFDPLPYPADDRLAILSNDFSGSATGGFALSYLNAQELRARSRTIEELALYLDWQNVNLSGEDGAYRLEANFTSAQYFRMLGFETVIGRPLPTEEASRTEGNVAVLSHGTWQRLFGGDGGVIGRSVLLNGMPFEVIGVVGPDHVDVGWESGSDTDVFLPLMAIEQLLPYADFTTRRQTRILSGVARFQPDAGISDLRRDLRAVSAALAVDYPDANQGWSFAAVPLAEELYEDLRAPTAVLLGGALLVIALVGVNLTNLTLMRATGRVREVAMRRALGAGPGRILRQLLVENVLLALLGGAVGVAAAAWTLQALASNDAVPVPRFTSLTLSPGTALAAGGVTLLLGTAFGLAPAMSLLRRPRLADDLREGGRQAGGRRTGRARAVLIVTEVALAFVLLVGAGLMLESFRVLRSTGYGFNTGNLLSVRLDLRGDRYAGDDAARAMAVTLVDRVGAIPGAQQAFIWSPNRIGHGNWVELLTREGRWDLYPEERTEASRHHVHPGALAALGIPLLEGRDVAASDGPGAPHVAIVSESLARHFWPDESAVGRRMASTENGSPISYQVVGVVADARHRTRLFDPFGPQLDVYFAFEQQPQRYLTLAVRTAADRQPGNLAPAVRAAVREIDPALPLYDVATMEERMRTEESHARLSALLIVLYAALAVALAALGVYGVLAHAVRGRTREIGVRVALGAGWAAIVRDVLGDTLKLVGVGLVFGIGAAMAGSRALDAALYGVAPWSVPIFGTVSALLIGIALLACVSPARRARAVDPTIALRADE